MLLYIKERVLWNCVSIFLVVLLIPFSLIGQACSPGYIEATISLSTGSFGYEIYWELTPTDSGCGNGTIINGGNMDVGCFGGGLDTNTQNGYPSNNIITETICLPIGESFTLHWVDDFGDASGVYQIYIGGYLIESVSAYGIGGTLEFIADVPPPHDASISAFLLDKNYTIIPQIFASPLNIKAKIENKGTDSISGINIHFNIYRNGNLVYSEDSLITNVLSPGFTKIIESPTDYLPTDTGLYVGEYIISIMEDDTIKRNDTSRTQVRISLDCYARDAGETESFGYVGLLSQGQNLIGNNFFLTDTVEITNIKFYFTRPPVGEVVHGVIYSTKFGEPDLNIAQTVSYPFQAGDTNGVWLTLPISGGAKGLFPGNYFFGIYQDFDELRLGFDRNVFNSQTSFISENNGLSWYTTESVFLNYTYVVRPVLRDFVCPLLVLSSVVDTCSDGTGQALLTVTGGDPPMSYEWDNGLSGFGIANLMPDTYTVTVTDAGDCEVIDSVKVEGFGPANVTYHVDSINCNGGFGNINVSASGLTGPFDYLWSDGSDDDDLLNAPGGVYFLTVTDRIGCEKVLEIDLYEPDSIVIHLWEVEDSLGSQWNMGATVTGGTLPYSYSWLTSPIQSGEMLFNIEEGKDYSLLITDANGCTQLVGKTALLVNISSEIADNGIKIYPNPCKDYFSIEMAHNTDNSTGYKILNSQGSLIKKGLITSSKMRIETAELSEGIYLVEISGESNQVYKLLKR